MTVSSHCNYLVQRNCWQQFERWIFCNYISRSHDLHCQYQIRFRFLTWTYHTLVAPGETAAKKTRAVLIRKSASCVISCNLCVPLTNSASLHTMQEVQFSWKIASSTRLKPYKSYFCFAATIIEIANFSRIGWWFNRSNNCVTNAIKNCFWFATAICKNDNRLETSAYQDVRLIRHNMTWPPRKTHCTLYHYFYWWVETIVLSQCGFRMNY